MQGVVEVGAGEQLPQLPLRALVGQVKLPVKSTQAARLEQEGQAV